MKALAAADYITTLALSFPSLQRFTPRPEKWDVDEFARKAGTASTGERHAIMFVVCIWNPGYAESKGWKFDALDALASWDSKHRNAFNTWAAKPYWP